MFPAILGVIAMGAAARTGGPCANPGVVDVTIYNRTAAADVSPADVGVPTREHCQDETPLVDGITRARADGDGIVQTDEAAAAVEASDGAGGAGGGGGGGGGAIAWDAALGQQGPACTHLYVADFLADFDSEVGDVPAPVEGPGSSSSAAVSPRRAPEVPDQASARPQEPVHATSDPLRPPAGGDTPVAADSDPNLGGYTFGDTRWSAPYVGTVQSGGGAMSQPVGEGALRNLQGATDISDNARGIELVNAALGQQTALRDAIRSDQTTLNSAYRSLPLGTVARNLDRARSTISRTVQDLSSAVGGFPAAERARFGNIYSNVRDKLDEATGILDRERLAQDSKSVAAFQGFLDPNNLSPLARTPGLSEVFVAPRNEDPTSSPARAQDALIDRIIMYAGLPPVEQAAIRSRLRLVEQPTLIFGNGTERSVTVLHNGYIFGGGESGIDCSTFVSAALPADIRKGRFTTLDFRLMWIHQKFGHLPRPPTLEPGRAKDLKATARAFVPIDLYAGERLHVGDLLVFRLPWKASGHIFIVRGYNPVTMRAEVLEAAQSAGTIREREFPLSFSPVTASRRYVRPGLLALRLKPTGKGACQFRADATSPPRLRGG